MGLVVTLLAILELARQSLVVLIQNQAFSPIYLQAA
jgi:segregation and condensation protein A